MKKTKKSIVIFYHQYCPDGLGAAWAARKKFGTRAEYVGVNHGESVPVNTKGKDVYMLDFCYEEKYFNQIKNSAKGLTILDHHISRKEAIMSVHDYRFDLNHSGAVISWNYFHPGKRIPLALKYIEDYDLWKFALPKTREVSAILRTYPFDFNSYDMFIKSFENSKKRKAFLAEGSAIMRYQNTVVEKSVEAAHLVRFAGHAIYAANSFTLTSEIGNALAKKRPPFAIVWSERKDRIIVSLRSRGDFDVSRVAMKFGGGGHKAAAGFSFLAGKTFPWKLLKS